jgi:hypothetical protein
MKSPRFPVACASLLPVLFVAACSSDAATSAQPVDAGTSALDSAVVQDTDAAVSMVNVDAAGPVVPSSKGSGGLTCASKGQLGGGRTYCVANVGGSEVKLAEPSAGAGPLRLVAYLHGDGAGAHKSDSAMKALLPFSDAHHAIVLSVLSPNKCAWWQAPTQTNCSAAAVPDNAGVNGDTFRDVLEAVRAGYDVSNDVAYYYGSSGGSIFLSITFMPKYGDKFPGIYALNCGGDAPSRMLPWALDASKRAGTKLFFTYGDQDFLKMDIEQAIPFFRGLSFPVDQKVIPGATHCAFDGHGRAVEIFESTFTKP